VSFILKHKLFYSIYLFILALLIASTGLCYLSPSNVRADSASITSVKVIPESGKVGEEIVISGSNFPGTLATIYWDKKLLISKIPIGIDGKFNYTFVVPESIKGTHTIGVMDNSNWEGAASVASFSVKSSFRIFPDVIEATSSITVYGTGFGDREQGIKVLLDGKSVVADNLKTDMSGNWSAIVSFITITKGRHTLSVVAASSSHLAGSELGFIISPWLEIKPASGPVGTQLFIYGWGLRQNEDGITLTWDNDIFFTNIRAEVDGTIKLDGSKREFGSFLSGYDYRESVYVPNTPQGNHVIGVYGSSFTPKGTFPNYPFTVTPNISLDPKSGKDASLVTITGTGFAANEQVTLKYDSKDAVNNIVADTTGSFSAQYQIPQTTATTHTFTATGTKGNSGNATFTLEKTASAAIPTLSSPANNIQVPSFKSVGDVYLGSFEYIGGLFSYLAGSQPSKKSTGITPLIWSMPADTGPWTYQLQISRDKNFSVLNLEKTLSTSEYNFIHGESHGNGIYYWRVKATDSAGTETQWSSISKFEVISMSGQVGLFSVLVLLLGIAAIIVVVLVIRRVSNRNMM
jgi:large repetitive protein